MPETLMLTTLSIKTIRFKRDCRLTATLLRIPQDFVRGLAQVSSEATGAPARVLSDKERLCKAGFSYAQADEVVAILENHSAEHVAALEAFKKFNEERIFEVYKEADRKATSAFYKGIVFTILWISWKLPS